MNIDKTVMLTAQLRELLPRLQSRELIELRFGDPQLPRTGRDLITVSLVPTPGGLMFGCSDVDYMGRRMATEYCPTTLINEFISYVLLRIQARQEVKLTNPKLESLWKKLQDGAKKASFYGLTAEDLRQRVFL